MAYMDDLKSTYSFAFVVVLGIASGTAALVGFSDGPLWLGIAGVCIEIFIVLPIVAKM